MIIREGDIVWYANILFSHNKPTGRAKTIIKPIEVKVTHVKETYGDYFSLNSTKTGEQVWAVNSYYFKFETWEEASGCGIYKTKEDAIGAWNSVIDNEIDRLTSLYEDAIKKVKSKRL